MPKNDEWIIWFDDRSVAKYEESKKMGFTAEFTAEEKETIKKICHEELTKKYL